MKVHVERNEGSSAAHVVECQQEGAIADMGRKVDGLDKAVFRGNGQPSLVSQTATNTQAINALTRLAWVTLTAVIGEAVLLVFRLFTGGGSATAQERMLSELASGVQALNRAVAVREIRKGGQNE